MALPKQIRGVLSALASIALFAPFVGAQPQSGPTSRPDITGFWDRSSYARIGGEMTDYGRGLLEDRIIFDDPNVYCEGFNVVRTHNSTNTPVKIFDHGDRLVFEYESNASVREVFRDGKTPSNNTRIIGESLGSALRDGTVEIRTSGFPDMLAHGGLAVTTDELQYMERYKLSEDGNTLEVFIMTSDPEIYQWPRVVMGSWERLPEDDYWFPHECVIYEDEEIYTPEIREKAEQMLRGGSDE